MTISKDLFLSILAMDAYNRGYNKGIKRLGGVGVQIVGAGAVSPTTYALGAQGQLALDFYEAVTGQNPLATEGGNAILTGHSRGGGLAGAVVGNC